MKRVVVAVALVVAACGSDSTKLQPVVARVDWTARTIEIENFDRYEIDFCEGDAPLLCVEEHGVIELLTRPDSGELRDGAEAWSVQFAQSIGTDRIEGCGPTYRLAHDLTEAARVGGHDGFRYGFRGWMGDPLVERVVGYGVVIDGAFHLIVMNALADEGCLSRESELPIAVAARLEPVLAAIAAGSTNLPRLPSPKL